MRVRLTPLFVLAAALAMPAQSRDPDVDKADEVEKPAEPPEIDRGLARDKLKELKAVFKDRDGDASARITALEQFVAHRHRTFVKELASIAVDPREDLEVRVIAAGGLARQPVKQAAPTIVKLLRTDRVHEEPRITAALVDALSANGYDEKAWRFVNPLFEREFAPRWVVVQKAVLRLIAEHGEKQSWRLLLAHHDQPQVEGDVDAADNPPAEYWEMRWNLWVQYRTLVREALFKVTGKRFENRAAALTWIEEEGKKNGLR